jgi:16S rRNA (uracil1498-N3)-methyltransferase
MRHRFHTNGSLVIGSRVVLAGEEMHHARVTRLREGEEIELFDGTGRTALGRLVALESSGWEVEIMAGAPVRESPRKIVLAMAVINLERFELVLQKATELGVVEIIPLLTERLEIRPERFAGKGDRWRKIIFEAVKQCGRAAIPTLAGTATVSNVLLRQGTKIVFDADHAVSPPAEVLEPLILLIGPEGGWSDEELRLAEASGAWFEHLGPRRLRAETAAIVATTLIAARYGDLESGA